MPHLFALLCCLLACKSLSASILLKPSAVLKNPFEITFETSASKYQTNHFWNAHGRTFPSYNHFQKEEYETYVEFGLTACDTLISQGDYAAIQESVNGNSRGFEEIEAGWKHQIYRDETLFAATQLIGIFPVGSHKSILRYGRKGMEFDLLLTKWLFGKSYCLYGDLQAGYRYYHGFPGDQLRAIGQCGIDFSQFQLILACRLICGVFNGRKERCQNIILLNPNFRTFQIEIQGLCRLASCASLAVGYAQRVWGGNAGNGGEFFGGLRLEF